MKHTLRATLIIHGTLQGTGFIRHVYNHAVEAALTGFVQPHADGTIEIQVTGWEKSIENFVRTLLEDPPQNTIIDSYTSAYQGEDGPWTRFEILPGDDQVEEPGSSIPSDYGICPACFDEMNDPRNRRFKDPFITIIFA